MLTTGRTIAMVVLMLGTGVSIFGQSSPKPSQGATKIKPVSEIENSRKQYEIWNWVVAMITDHSIPYHSDGYIIESEADDASLSITRRDGVKKYYQGMIFIHADEICSASIVDGLVEITIKHPKKYGEYPYTQHIRFLVMLDSYDNELRMVKALNDLGALNNCVSKNLY